MKTMSWDEHKKELLKDKKFREELEKIQPEFELARQIIKLRIQNKMSQAELAKKAKTAQPVISRIESGNANPRLDTIEKIGRVFNKKVRIKLT